jgi:hypothetical protein
MYSQGSEQTEKKKTKSPIFLYLATLLGACILIYKAIDLSPYTSLTLPKNVSNETYQKLE